MAEEDWNKLTKKYNEYEIAFIDCLFIFRIYFYNKHIKTYSPL